MIKVAAVSLNQIPLDWEHNKNNILQAINEARKEQVAILCCPELCITGYGCEDWFLSHSTQANSLKILQEIAPATAGIIVAVGLPLLFQEKLYNTACLLVDGKIAGFVAKQNLPKEGVYYEPRWFTPWPSNLMAEYDLKALSIDNGNSVPIGDIVFDFKYFRLGFEICEDAWVINRTAISLAQRNVDILLNPSASHFTLGKTKQRKRFIIEASRGFKIAYIYANLLGNEAGRLIYDGDTYIAAGDNLIAQGPRFSFKDYVLTTAEIDFETLQKERNQYNKRYTDRKMDKSSFHLGVIHMQQMDFLSPLSMLQNGQRITKPSIEIPNTEMSETKTADWENSEHLLQEEFTRASSLSLWDYLHKSRAKGYVLNLSGGADSATCACLVYLMIVLALKELGAFHFKEKLAYLFKSSDTHNAGSEEDLGDIKKFTEPAEFMPVFLYCLYQRTLNNQEMTWQAALSLSQALGFPLASFSIDNDVKSYCEIIEPIILRSLDWSKDDIALQNIQARVRSPSIWLLANIRNAIPLCPSNRSEVAMGYTTMDGDTSGGICPIAGVSKSFILNWLKWLENRGPKEHGPIPALKAITQQKPTAELRPITLEQTDEEDLMPFKYLDEIERLFVRDKKSPLEIFRILSKQESIEPKIIGKYIERFIKLWCQNQWKRERLAPTFHIDEESVDPKTWCRFPILSGGFKKELETMWDWINKK